jgi:hypothetical protein
VATRNDRQLPLRFPTPAAAGAKRGAAADVRAECKRLHGDRPCMKTGESTFEDCMVWCPLLNRVLE